MINRRVYLAGLIFALFLCLCIDNKANASIKVSLQDDSIYVGQKTELETNADNVKYRCSNTKIAYINSEGIITGKQSGSVKVWAYTDEGDSKKLQLNVKAKQKLPEKLPVCIDEIKVIEQGNELNGNDDSYSVSILNKSNYGTVKKAIVTLELDIKNNNVNDKADTVNNNQGGGCVSPQSIVLEQTEESLKPIKKEISVTATNIKPGKQSDALECKGIISGSVDKMIIKKIQLYSDKALCTYKFDKGEYSFNWGTKDITAPAMKGLLKNNSFNGQDVYRVYYSDKKDDYTFKEYVSATDNRSNKVKISTDTSKINWKKSGVYKVYYKATDEAGNTSKSWAKVQVYVAGKPEKFADQLLKSCINDKWSDAKKVRAIYAFVKSHHSYVDRGSRAHWRSVGVSGFYAQSGDCYSYYSISRLMMTRAGIPNIMIRRNPAPPGHNHWWNLVYVNGGWYHFDTTPRKGRYLCLQTDSQIHNVFPGYEFRFPGTAYPARASNRISNNP